MTAGAPLHASCVALEGRGLLILGAPGAGKSQLALELMAHGAELVADDQVALARRGDSLIARAPETLPALIEARGIGLLPCKRRAEAVLTLAIDLDREETQRLPRRRILRLLDAPLPLILRPRGLSAGALATALRLWPPIDPEDAGGAHGR